MKTIHTLSKLTLLATALGLAQHSFAQTTGMPNNASESVDLEQSLRDDGYIERSNGLFASPNLAEPAFVATNAQGRQALVLEMHKDRATYLARAQKNGIQAQEQNVLNSFDRTIADASKIASVAKITNSSEGPCIVPNGATLFASATSNAGTSASAFAVNSIDFGPATPTANYAEASTEFSTVSNTGVGTSPASSSTSNSFSCFAYSYGSVTCPGESAPAVSAYISTFSTRPRCFL
jgi:hypothetical protein